jgi:hypothetical protein
MVIKEIISRNNFAKKTNCQILAILCKVTILEQNAENAGRILFSPVHCPKLLIFG